MSSFRQTCCRQTCHVFLRHYEREKVVKVDLNLKLILTWRFLQERELCRGYAMNSRFLSWFMIADNWDIVEKVECRYSKRLLIGSISQESDSWNSSSPSQVNQQSCSYNNNTRVRRRVSLDRKSIDKQIERLVGNLSSVMNTHWNDFLARFRSQSRFFPFRF